MKWPKNEAFQVVEKQSEDDNKFGNGADHNSYLMFIYHLEFKRLQLFDNFTLCSSSFLDYKQTVAVWLKNLDLNVDKNGDTKMFNEPGKEITIEGQECFVNRDRLKAYFKKTTVDGKQCWKWNSFAIWYLSSQNIWILGDVGDVGKASGAMYAKNDNGGFSGLTDVDNKWKLWNGTSFISPSDPFDIRCMDKALYGKNSRLILLTKSYYFVLEQ